MSMEDRRTDDLFGRVRALTQELSELRSLVTSRAGGTIYPNGSIAIAQSVDEDGLAGWRAYDPSGVVRVRMGQLDTDSYGAAIYDGDGNRRLYVDESGFGLPRYSFALRDPAAVKTVTSGTFTQAWQVVMPQVLGAGVECWIGWATDPGTTGEIRVNSFSAQSSALTLAAGSTANAYIRWLHQVPLGTGPIAPVVEARRTGGAGNVSVYQVMAWLREPNDCTTAGVWV